MSGKHYHRSHGRSRKQFVQRGQPNVGRCTCAWMHVGHGVYRYYSRNPDCRTHGWRHIETIHSPLLEGDEDDEFE